MKNKKAFAEAVDKGLSSSPKKLPTRFIYDEEGSRLFVEIMKLPEYYLTEVEHEILETHKEKIAEIVGSKKFNLIELGAGNGEKTTTLLSHFLSKSLQFRYVPIDISKSSIDGLQNELSSRFPGLTVSGLEMEYFEGLRWMKEHSERRNLVLFLGSNIGNFPTTEINRFLEGLHNSLNEGDLVAIGFDLKKDYEIIRRAYYDSAGITRDFNLNLVKRINRELGGNFDISNIEYYGIYNPVEGRHEAYLYSQIDQKVRIEASGKEYFLRAFEPINTEYSYKFSIEDIEELAKNHRFKIINHLRDKKGYFIDSIWMI